LKKGETRKYDSIQWVIDALGNDLIDKDYRENHRTESIRADEDLWWCPECKKKWNWYEGKVWSSRDIKLWDAKICPNCDSLV
jgi:hypothetical protein